MFSILSKTYNVPTNYTMVLMYTVIANYLLMVFWVE